MTKEVQDTIRRLRKQGAAYKKISELTGVSMNTISSWCRRHPVDEKESRCLFCGAHIEQTPHRKEKRFCCDACRFQWWKSHPEARVSRKPYSHTCAFCGAAFFSSRPESKYCGRACFAKAREKQHV